MSTTRRTIIGPFNRVEGDLEVDVLVEDGEVRDARVNSPLFRGFEQILRGKDPGDALVYTPRICGICSVAQSVAASMALADAQNASVAVNGRLATNLLLATENMADHLTHFYLFFMPDFARGGYDGKDWHAETAARFRAQGGSATPEMLAARAAFLHITGILAGKWPHTLAIQPGGTSRAIEARERLRLLSLVRQFRRFLEDKLFGDRLEAVNEIDSSAALTGWATVHGHSDLGRFLLVADDLQLDRLGRAEDRFLSFGVYDDGEQPLFPRGTWQVGKLAPVDTAAITEDVSYSWMHDSSKPAHPFDGATLPSLENKDAYSWCKAPRLDGKVMETGAVARQLIAGHPLIVDLVKHRGGNVKSRIVARLLELARVVPEMERWAMALTPGEPFCIQGQLPDDVDGQGLTEAARGSLGHWVRIRDGKIANYQIIAPTTWNFSPRDSKGTPGALEQALVGTPVIPEDEHRTAIQHVVRSFDPCMVCTVH